jgi:hypothetical protein
MAYGHTWSQSPTGIPMILHCVSLMVKQHNHMEVDLYQPQLKLSVLKIMTEQRMAENHRAKTPSDNEPSKKGAHVFTCRGVTTMDNIDQKALPCWQPLGLVDHPCHHYLSRPPFRCSIPHHLGQVCKCQHMHTLLWRRISSTSLMLNEELLQTSSPKILGKNHDSKLAPIWSPYYMGWTEEGLALSTDTFLYACRLLAHYSNRRVLQIDGMSVDPNTIIYVVNRAVSFVLKSYGTSKRWRICQVLCLLSRALWKLHLAKLRSKCWEFMTTPFLYWVLSTSTAVYCLWSCGWFQTTFYHAMSHRQCLTYTSWFHACKHMQDMKSCCQWMASLCWKLLKWVFLPTIYLLWWTYLKHHSVVT